VGYEEIQSGKIEAILTKKEMLLNSEKFNVLSVSLRIQTSEVNGFLMGRSGQNSAIFFSPEHDAWMNLKSMIRTEGDRIVERFVLPLMDDYRVFKVDSSDGSGNRAFFTPLHKN